MKEALDFCIILSITERSLLNGMIHISKRGIHESSMFLSCFLLHLTILSPFVCQINQDISHPTRATIRSRSEHLCGGERQEYWICKRALTNKARSDPYFTCPLWVRLLHATELLLPSIMDCLPLFLYLDFFLPFYDLFFGRFPQKCLRLFFLLPGLPAAFTENKRRHQLVGFRENSSYSST